MAPLFGANSVTTRPGWSKGSMPLTPAVRLTAHRNSVNPADSVALARVGQQVQRLQEIWQ
jgi:hypothetical protein